MPDREKIIEIIKARINDDENDSEGSSGFICVGIDEAKEIVAMLNEQEEKIENLKEIIKKADYTLEIAKDKINDLLKKTEGR